MSSESICVMHSFPIWLPQTQTWMYNQVKYLPDNIEVHVVCEKTEHLDQFYLPNIHCLHKTSWWRYFWEKGIRKILLPRYRGFFNCCRKKDTSSNSSFAFWQYWLDGHEYGSENWDAACCHLLWV